MTETTATTPEIKHTNRTAKVVELVGSSPKSFEDAVQVALHDAARTTNNITGCEVENFTVKCDNGTITEFRANIKVAFGVERAD